MSEPLFHQIAIAWIILGIALIPPLLLFTAPFGRHTSKKWGPLINNRAGWVIMELVSPLILWTSFISAGATWSVPVAILMGLWSIHYINRSVVYPIRIRTTGKKIPVLIVLAAIIFNAINSWTNGTYFGAGWGGYDADWLLDPRFIVGLIIMVFGASINLKADAILFKLRSLDEVDYKIPRGGLFEKVTCPNFLGEIIEWTGYAIACWNLPALGFAIWTTANLVPRALSHHRWYHENFDDYPANRCAIFPGIL